MTDEELAEIIRTAFMSTNHGDPERWTGIARAVRSNLGPRGLDSESLSAALYYAGAEVDPDNAAASARWERLHQDWGDHHRRIARRARELFGALDAPTPVEAPGEPDGPRVPSDAARTLAIARVMVDAFGCDQCRGKP